jgi:hypothetical protein
MYLLDNGCRGCTATAAVLGQYTGLTERTVDKYRRELEALGLLFAVAGTRGWHVILPSNLPPDRATVAQIQAYARRIGEHIGMPEVTPPGVVSHTPGGADIGSEKPPAGGDSDSEDCEPSLAGLTSTRETHEEALTSALLRNGSGTCEEQRANPEGEVSGAPNQEEKRRAWRDAVQHWR